MRFSQVKAVRIPKGSTQEIRHNGKTLWNSIRARYVSLGDSIAAGQGITDDPRYAYPACLQWQYGTIGNTETDIIPNSYTNLVHTELMQRYGGTVNATSFARSGDTVADLMEKLNHTAVQNAIAKANYVTVCIGANDVLQPAMSRLEEYINAGDSALAEIATTVEQNLAVLNDDSNANSYTALFNKLATINPNAKYVFTTVYNPYKYLWLDESRNGFFAPLLNTIPQMNIDVDKAIEDMFLGGKDLSYYDITQFKWVSIELDFDLDNVIKDGLLSTSVVQMLFDRVNGLCDWSENFVTRLNNVLRNKIGSYANANFLLADTKAVFDTYPDRPVTADVHYNDLVNVEYTRGYDTAQMDWGALWRDKYGSNVAQYWTDLAWKHLSFSNALPSLNVADYVSFDLNGFATDLVQQMIDKVIVPDVDPHPETHGQLVMKNVFTDTMF